MTPISTSRSPQRLVSQGLAPRGHVLENQRRRNISYHMASRFVIAASEETAESKWSQLHERVTNQPTVESPSKPGHKSLD
ncbi:hypothetical protein AAE478_006325 [Parahypoxylon ruwenzoriense]